MSTIENTQRHHFAHAVSVGGEVPSGSFAMPKSSGFGRPSGVTKILPDLRSR